MKPLPLRSGRKSAWPGRRITRRLTQLCAWLPWLLAISGCSLLKPLLGDADPAQSQARAGPPPIDLHIEAPEALKPLLQKHLDLALLLDLRTDEPPSAGELSRLAAAAPAQARELLQTEGYFDAKVTVRRETAPLVAPAAAGDAPVDTTSAPPSATAPFADSPTASGRPRQRLQAVWVTVVPGEPTLVSALEVSADGELRRLAEAGDADARALQRSLPAVSELQAGEVFRNPDWSASKQALLSKLRAAGYAAASIAESRADIDATARTARLRVRLDSGPLFRAGPLQVSGLVHHDEATVHNLSGFGPGAPLTEARLLDYQERLQAARLFQAVSVSFEPDPAVADAAPVRVRLVELPLQQATVAVGVTTNAGARVSVEHTHRRPFDWPVVAYNKFEWGQKNQKWAGDFQTHAGPGFYRNLLGVQIDRDLSDSDVVLSQRLRLGRTQDTTRIERLYFVELLRSRRDDLAGAATTSPGGPSVATALSVNLHLARRDLDNILLPTRGITGTLQLGLGEATSHGGDNGPFTRLYGRLTGYLPLGGSWYGQGRLELGGILRRNGVEVPDALGFRAGGEDSVRGYAYRELAPKDANGATVSGDALMTSSLELARPIMASLPSLWGAVFVDAGRATNGWRGFSPALGYGVGVRWRSPIGPLRVDLAYADELRKVRLHLSVGIAL